MPDTKKTSMKIKNKKALSMSMIVGLVLLMVFLMILLIAYIQMGGASGTINKNIEGNLSRLTDLSGSLG